MIVRGSVGCPAKACEISAAVRRQSSNGQGTVAVMGPRVMRQGRVRPRARANSSDPSVLGEMMRT